ncbi:MAG TPA: response regulator transcription factor [Symbiobacteriaceae bacterium]|nr:response regulator transcription factor [Symbiobacteriaceae bacterium]
MSTKVLLIEDDNDLAYGVSMALTREGCQVTQAATGPDGLRLALDGRPDVVILDIGLPGLDGLQVCRAIRQTSAVPILFLTARAEELDRVMGLELGGDDYLTKPFSIRELCARVRALHRRASGRVLEQQEERRIEMHGLTIWPERRKVQRGAEEIRLTNTEFALLLTLARRPGRVFSKQELLEAAWEGQGQFMVDHVVNVHLANLREKVERDPSRPELVLTVRGAGYKLKEVAP